MPKFSKVKYGSIRSQVGDSIVYNQRKRLILGDLIKETLELLEVSGCILCVVRFRLGNGW